MAVLKPVHSFAVASVIAVLSILLPCASRVAAADKEFEPLLQLAEEQPDGAKMAKALADTFLTEDQWRQEVKKLRQKYEDWERDTQGDMSRYLNDRLIIVALSAANGKVDKIQRGILWLAFYQEFEQEQPGIVAKFVREHQPSLSKLFTDFTWEKASQYIKNKEWRKDLEDHKKASVDEIRESSQPITASADK